MAEKLRNRWKRWLPVGCAIVLVYCALLVWYFASRIRAELEPYLWISELQSAGQQVFVPDGGNIYVLTDEGVECFDPQGQKIYAHELAGEVFNWPQYAKPPIDSAGRLYFLDIDYQASTAQASLVACGQPGISRLAGRFNQPSAGTWQIILLESMTAVVGDNGEVILLNVEGNELQRFIRQPLQAYSSLYSPVSVLTGSCNNSLCLIDSQFKLVVLDDQGAVRWEQQLPGSGNNVAVNCTEDGTILVVADALLLAYDQLGHELWRYDPQQGKGGAAGTGGSPQPSGMQADLDMPVIAPDGSIAYLDDVGNLYKLDSVGNLLWSAQLSNYYGPMAIVHGPEGSLYVMVSYGGVTKYDASGQQLYDKQLDMYINSPAISPAGIVYELRGNSLCALDIDEY